MLLSLFEFSLARVLDAVARVLDAVARVLDAVARVLDAVARVLDAVARVLDAVARVLDAVARVLWFCTLGQNHKKAAPTGATFPCKLYRHFLFNSIFIVIRFQI